MDPKRILNINCSQGIQTANDISNFYESADLTELPWDQFFESKRFITFDNNNFNIYTCGHGKDAFFLIHGAGTSSLSWGLFAKEVLKIEDVLIIAIDLRGHGLTSTTNDTDFQKEVLVADVTKVIELCITEYKISKTITLIGHSLGGALVTWIAACNNSFHTVCLVVIDALESVALDIHAMENYLQCQPISFKSMATAIQYSSKTRKMKNITADRLVMPGRLKKVKNENNNEGDDCKYEWKVDLLKTKQYWNGWFDGMSKAFLSCGAAKLLVLPDTSRLDKTLLIGQMQGAYRIELIKSCGHCVHEENPTQVAKAISSFISHQGLI